MTQWATGYSIAWFEIKGLNFVYGDIIIMQSTNAQFKSSQN